MYTDYLNTTVQKFELRKKYLVEINAFIHI